jgi:hypothetical protein
VYAAAAARAERARLAAAQSARPAAAADKGIYDASQSSGVLRR